MTLCISIVFKSSYQSSIIARDALIVGYNNLVAFLGVLIRNYSHSLSIINRYLFEWLISSPLIILQIDFFTIYFALKNLWQRNWERKALLFHHSLSLHKYTACPLFLGCRSWSLRRLQWRGSTKFFSFPIVKNLDFLAKGMTFFVINVPCFVID